MGNCSDAGWASGRSLAAGISSNLTAAGQALALCAGGAKLCDVLDIPQAAPFPQGISSKPSCFYRARASTRVTSSGCSPPAIQSVTAPVTSSLMRASG